MPKEIKSHTFRGRRYKIEKVTQKELRRGTPENEICFGECDPPDKKDKAIKIYYKLKGLPELTTYLHEICHAVEFSWDEQTVEQVSNDIARFLWRSGYRKVENNEPS